MQRSAGIADSEGDAVTEHNKITGIQLPNWHVFKKYLKCVSVYREGDYDFVLFGHVVCT